MSKAPTTLLPQAFYFVKVLLIFFLGSIINGLVNFLFLPDQRISGVDWGGSKSNMSKMVSIGSSSVCGTSLESFKRRFCNWFWCLMCVFGSFYNVNHITNSFFNYSTFPTERVILIFFQVNFSPGLNLFLGANVVFSCLFCFGSSLSKTDLIFLVNIVSAGETASGVLGLGVILYTRRNCCTALSIEVPDAFLSARFNVSTISSA